MSDRDAFVRWLKEALGTYHDPVLLQTNPLLEFLAIQPLAGETATAGLRQRIRNAIESLRPLPSLATTRPEWLRYRLLTLRYLRSRSPVEVSDELGISLTTFYRYNQEGIEAVANVLWEEHQRERNAQTATIDGAGEPSPDQLALDRAISLAREAARSAVDLAAVLENAHRIIVPLASQRGLTVKIDAPASLPVTWGDAAAIRQIVLNVLMEGLRLAGGVELTLSVAAKEVETLWCVRGLAGAEEPADDPQRPTALEISRALLGVYGGRLWFGGLGREKALCFALPLGKPKNILIVDDDGDTIRLYRRWLQAHGYAVSSAHDAGQMAAQLAGGLPDLVLLDVLMPEQDGWDVLERLRALPETAHLPVLVCSVLSQPELALSLGATQVLRKPITEETLVKAVQAALGQPGSRGSEHPGVTADT